MNGIFIPASETTNAAVPGFHALLPLLAWILVLGFAGLFPALAVVKCTTHSPSSSREASLAAAQAPPPVLEMDMRDMGTCQGWHEGEAAAGMPDEAVLKLPGQSSRAVSVSDLKKMVGTHPVGTGLCGDFVIVSRDGNKALLQSREQTRKYGISITIGGREAVFRGQTFVILTCENDFSPFGRGGLVSIPASRPLRINSVGKNARGQVIVDAWF